MEQADEQKISQLVKQAWGDKQLRKALEDDPLEYLRQNGISIREGAEARLVKESDSISFEMRMPQSERNDSELSDEALGGVVGGAGTSGSSGQIFLKFTFKLVAVKTVSW